MKDAGKFPLNVRAVTDFPENTFLLGNVIVINVGGPSPGWVLQLAGTRSGMRLLRRVLAGIYRRHLVAELLEELASKLGMEPGDD